MTNTRKFIQGLYESMLRGEWWIDDNGFAEFADVDTGHWAVAYQAMLGVNLEEYPDDDVGIEAVQDAFDNYVDGKDDTTFPEICENLEISPDVVVKKYEQDDDALFDMVLRPLQEIGYWNKNWEDIIGGNVDAYGCYLIQAMGGDFDNAVKWGSDQIKDPREWAITNAGWIRVAGDNFQLNILDDESLSRIRGFIEEEVPEEDLEEYLQGGEEVGIEELANGGSYMTVELGDLFEKTASQLKGGSEGLLGKMRMQGYRFESELTEGEVINYDVEDEDEIFDLDNYFDVYEDLEKLYEIEYKLYLLTNYPFRGYPQRYENVKRRYEEIIMRFIHRLSNIFIFVFKDWLAQHAITNPEEWVKVRYLDNDELQYAIESGEGSEINEYINNMIKEWWQFQNPDVKLVWGPNGMQYPYPRDLETQFIQRCIHEMPETKEFLDAVANEYISMYIEDMQEQGDDEVNTDIDSYDPEDFYDSVLETIDWSYAPDIEEVFREFGLQLFKEWYGYWQQQGIDETRDRIENAYYDLYSISKMEQYEKGIPGEFNRILNLMHQTGSMMDYVGEKTDLDQRKLEFLSNMPESTIELWKSEMERLGVDIEGEEGISPALHKEMK